MKTKKNLQISLSKYDYIIAGLGNPGKEYEETSHNAGRNAVLLFAKTYDFPPCSAGKNNALISDGVLEKKHLLAILPETFMNASGNAIRPLKFSKKSASEKLIVLHDDLDLPLGTIKIVKNRGSAGHKGVESIMRSLKTEDFTRIRIGIAKPREISKSQSEKTVQKIIIGKLSPEDKTLLKKGIQKASDALTSIIARGISVAMNEFN